MKGLCKCFSCMTFQWNNFKNLSQWGWNLIRSLDIVKGIYEGVTSRRRAGSLYFSVPRLFARPPALFLIPSPSSWPLPPICIYRFWPPICFYRPWLPIFIYQLWPPICICRPWPGLPICIYQTWPTACVYRFWQSFAFTGNGPLTVFLNPHPSYDPQFVFTSPGQDFTTSTTTGITTIYHHHLYYCHYYLWY